MIVLVLAVLVLIVVTHSTSPARFWTNASAFVHWLSRAGAIYVRGKIRELRWIGSSIRAGSHHVTPPAAR